MPSLGQIAGKIGSRGKWEKDKFFRVQALESSVSRLQQEGGARKAGLAEIVLAMYRNGQVENQGLRNICADIEAHEAKINEAKKTLQDATSEQYVEQSDLAAFSQLQSSNGGNGGEAVASSRLVCPKCGTGVPIQFCPNCGTDALKS